MTHWDRYRERVFFNGETKRDRLINEVKRSYSKRMQDSAPCKDVTIDDEARKIVVINTEDTSKKEIYSLPNETFTLGSVVAWNKSHWLMTEVDKDEDIVSKGTIELCNRELVWQNPKTGEIHQRWATVDKPYYSNLDEGEVINNSSREFKIQLPYDEESSLLDVDKRFMLEKIGDEPKTYICTSADTISERYDHDDGIKGFLILNVRQDQYNKTVDNPDLWICDYVDPTTIDAPTDVPGDELQVIISYRDNTNIKAGGTAKKFTASLIDGNGEVISGSTYHWTVNIADGFEQDISYNESGGTLSVEAKNNSALIGNILLITVTASINDSTYTEEIKAKVVGLFG